ncbi:Lipoyltransferase 1 mitochondrial [Dissostichus eleginoides]|uniref:Lipoyltransferase 1 mitochondrial n=1 Tax=Dissostichus eleginoides TaxID=100907 RepID=A0AAD9B405_DISEL|nr:Lipoyltransferase 1 mitochondrial [Dissostichus eleginoides]
MIGGGPEGGDRRSEEAQPTTGRQSHGAADIVLNGHLKISGSASRLSRKSSYHHLTLLHSADRASLSSMLRPSCAGIHSNATPSVRSPVANLSDHAPSLKWEELMEALQVQVRPQRRALARRPVRRLGVPRRAGGGGGSARLGLDVREDAEVQRSDESAGGGSPEPAGGQRTDGRRGAEPPGGLDPREADRSAERRAQREKFCRKHAAAALNARLLQGGGAQHRVKGLCDDIINALG